MRNSLHRDTYECNISHFLSWDIFVHLDQDILRVAHGDNLSNFCLSFEYSHSIKDSSAFLFVKKAAQTSLSYASSTEPSRPPNLICLHTFCTLFFNSFLGWSFLVCFRKVLAYIQIIAIHLPQRYRLFFESSFFSISLLRVFYFFSLISLMGGCHVCSHSSWFCWLLLNSILWRSLANAWCNISISDPRQSCTAA